MLKKIRWRFIAAAMGAFTAVIVVLLCVLNLWNYDSMAKQQDETLQKLLEVVQHEQLPAAGQGMPPFAQLGRFSPEVPYMLRFFAVHYDADGRITHINQDYIASITAADAEQFAAKALADGKRKGFYREYRYCISDSAAEQTVIFLNSERELQAARSLLWLTVAIACICLAVVFLLVFLLSKRAIAPYLRNLENQKQFITNASHELKTPLTAISTSADVLALELSDNEWVRTIRAQSGRLSKLISNLVTLSRLDEGDPFPNRAGFCLSDALWEISEPYVSLAQAAGKHFSQQIDDALRLTGDRAAIQQMVSILLDNALKYTADGGRITLLAHRVGKQVEISVANTSPPTHSGDLSRLFDRFYRGDESHSSQISGTGIGLSIARATAEAHGGAITAAQEGDFLVFRIRL